MYSELSLNSPEAVSRERVFLRSVGLWTMLGLLLTVATAGGLLAQPQAMFWFYHATEKGLSLSVLGWVALLMPLVLMFFIAPMARSSSSAGGLTAAYLAITVCFGITLAPLALIYQPAVLVHTLLATGAAFGGFAAWGWMTDKSLAGFGRFAFMGLIGLIVLGFIQMFWPSNTLNFLLGVGGVIVFTLLTSWDMQKIRQMAHTEQGHLSIVGALMLYLDFINLFLSLLRLMGNNNRS